MPSNRFWVLAALMMLSFAASSAGQVTAKPPSQRPVTCGTVINTPGIYIISGVMDCSTPHGIDITTSDVTLQFYDGGQIVCTGCPTSGGTEIGIDVYDPAGGPISGINIVGGGGLYAYPTGISFAGVTGSQVSGMSFQYEGTDLLLGSDTNGDPCKRDLFTDNLSYSASIGDISGQAIDTSTFIGNELQGTNFGGIGFGIQILNGNGNVLTGNTVGGFLTGIELGGTGSSGAANNILMGNRVGSNTTGILVMPPANRNRSEANLFYGNFSLDIDDGNSSCGKDEWTRDVFLTANQSCIH